MKTYLFSALFLLFTSFSWGQNSVYTWGTTHGLSSNDFGKAIAMDNAGYTYVGGHFRGKVDFGIGATVFELSGNGGDDAFIQKLAPNGDFVWAKRIGSTAAESVADIVVDNIGNIYVTGHFSGTVDFDPNPGIYNLTSRGNQDVFVMKLDTAGNLIWAKGFGGTNDDGGHAIKLDGNGFLYTTGWVWTNNATIDMNPGAGVDAKARKGFKDIFIQKLDTAGNYVWSHILGGSNVDEGRDITVDADLNVYLTGYFKNTMDADPGAAVANLSASNSDSYVIKLDSSGAYKWSFKLGNNDYEEGYGIEVDADFNVYSYGVYRGNFDFDPGAGSFGMQSRNLTRDMYFHKVDSSGNFIWAKNIGGNGDDYPADLYYDGQGSFYITGHFSGSADMDPNPNISNILQGAGSDDAFVQKMDTSGAFQWAVAIGGTNADRGGAVTADATGNVRVTGYFYGTIDLIPGLPTYNQASRGAGDIFTVAFEPCVPTTTVDTRVACDSLTWIDGTTYYSNDTTATYTLLNVLGCDSIVKLNLTISNSYAVTDVQTACDSLTWIDGNTYTTNNTTATHTVQTASGCDSVVTLNLTMNYTVNTTDTQSACNSFTWIDGNKYVSNNTTATYTLQTTTGCDSIVTLNLTVLGLNMTVTQKADSLIASASRGVSYRWIDCSNNTAVAGATAKVFVPSTAGTYALVLTLNGCTDTSACYTVTPTISTTSALNTSAVQLYPNPTSGLVKLQLAKSYSTARVLVRNALGQIVAEQNANNTVQVTLNIEGATGLYTVEVQAEGQIIARMKLIKD